MPPISRGTLVGIDVGTTVLKAAALDARSGALLAASSRPLPTRAAPDGTREQDPARLDRALRQVLACLAESLGRRWTRVAGIGLAAQGGSMVIADKATGKALTPVTLWNDTRAAPFMQAIARKKPVAFWRRRTFRDTPGAGLGRLLWLRASAPHLIDEANIFAGVGEYFFFGLTRAWRQDAGNALQNGCYSTVNRDLDAAQTGLAGVPASFYAPMRRGHRTRALSRAAATLYGLPEGIPVAGPYIDQEAGYMAALGTSRRPLQCSLGTAWVGNLRLPRATTGRSPIQLVLPSPCDAGRLVVQPLLTGNAAWDWGLATLVDRRQTRALAALDRVFADDPLPPPGLVALPWHTRQNPLAPACNGAGVFLGVGTHTDRDQLVRALAAGMVYEMARVFDAVKASGRVDSVVLTGGAAKGRFFQRLLAAAFDPLPVHVLRDQDYAGCRGALFGLGRRAACGGSLRVRRPSARLRARVREGYDLYVQAFRCHLGNEDAGKPFAFK